MSKAWIAKDGEEVIGCSVTSVTEAQLQALRDASFYLPPELNALSSILKEMLSAYQATVPLCRGPISLRTATDIKTTREAARLLNIKYDKNDATSLDLDFELPDMPTELSAHYEAMIADLRFNDYILDRTDGSFSHAILELVLFDRLKVIQGQDENRHLHLCAQVDLSLEVANGLGGSSTIQGRADWVLGYCNSQTETKCLFVIVEAKHGDNEISIGMPQLMIYMKAVQAAKQLSTVWGMLSDAYAFQFAYVDNTRTFQTSESLTWRSDKSAILVNIGHILLVTLETGMSNKKRLIKVKYPDLKAFRSSLAGPWKSGGKPNDVEERTQ